MNHISHTYHFFNHSHNSSHLTNTKHSLIWYIPETKENHPLINTIRVFPITLTWSVQIYRVANERSIQGGSIPAGSRVRAEPQRGSPVRYVTSMRIAEFTDMGNWGNCGYYLGFRVFQGVIWRGAFSNL